MIVTRLRGGLGNQLFQYAAGFRLATRHGAALRLDLTKFADFSHTTPRSYELGVFALSGAPATKREIAAVTGESRGWLWRRLAPRDPSIPTQAATEQHFHFDPDVLALPDGVLLDGYWQSERYFEDVSERLRQELAFRDPPAGRNAEMAATLAGANAVSLHVRRGDYATNPTMTAMHGMCPIDYYERAVRFVADRVRDPVFFLFSDDPDWVRDHLKIREAMVVVDHNGPDAGHEDLRLMSGCRHHILANSTFSWWGAWLDPRPEKIVVAPRRWFAVDTIDTTDLLPDGWIRL